MSLPRRLETFPSPECFEGTGSVKQWASTPTMKTLLNNFRKVLVLDLDETLIHCSTFPPHPKVESFTVEYPDESVYVHKRPGVDAFLREITQVFDTYIYTYGTMFYADPILDVLCPMIRQNHRLFREKCEVRNGVVRKDLKRFGRPLSAVILVEDNPDAKRMYPDNTIIVPKWNGTPHDDILVTWLPEMLRRCVIAGDVREVIRSIPAAVAK